MKFAIINWVTVTQRGATGALTNQLTQKK